MSVYLLMFSLRFGWPSLTSSDQIESDLISGVRTDSQDSLSYRRVGSSVSGLISR